MAEHPLLAMPSPERINPSPRRPPRERISLASPDRQAVRIGPKFRRLEWALADPKVLADMRGDPAAIVPERALVFELSSQMVNFYRAIRRIPGLEFLGEDEDEKAPDEDFFVMDAQGRKTDKQVSRHLFANQEHTYFFAPSSCIIWVHNCSSFFFFFSLKSVFLSIAL